MCMQGFGVGGGTCGTKPLGKPRHIGENNIKMDFQDIGWCCGLD